jgi:ribonuclease-3
MNPLEQRLNYKFRNPLLLAEALAHPSVGHESHRHHFNNQRLEFLGDAVLQLIFTAHLFHLFPEASEGILTKLRSRLVSREGLKVHAQKLRLGEYLIMGKGEEASGGRQRASTLADAYEAVIGAMYLDGGFDVTRDFVLAEAKPDFEKLTIDSIEINPKGRLQEILQALSPTNPTYLLISESGPEHQKSFMTKVIWQGLELGTGEGSSKKEAETAAAVRALVDRRWVELTGEEPEQRLDNPAIIQNNY